MVAARASAGRRGLQDFRRLALDRLGSLRMVARSRAGNAVIDRRHVGKQVALERILRIVCRRSPMRVGSLWPEARAGAGSTWPHRTGFPRRPPPHLELFGVFPPHEGKDAGMRRIEGAAVSDFAVIAWSIDLLAMLFLRRCAGRWLIDRGKARARRQNPCARGRYGAT